MNKLTAHEFLARGSLLDENIQIPVTIHDTNREFESDPVECILMIYQQEKKTTSIECLRKRKKHELPKKMFSKNFDSNQPIKIDSKWKPGTKLKLMSYSEAIKSLKSGDPDKMGEAISSNILVAPKLYNEISNSIKSSSEESLIDLLLPLLKHKEYKVRCCIPPILAEIGNDSLIPNLEDIMQHDQDSQVVKNASLAIEKIKSNKSNIESVKFSRRYTKLIPGNSAIGTTSVTGTYEEYTAPNKVVARAFLERKTVTKAYFYIEIITPEGNLGKDNMSIY